MQLSGCKVICQVDLNGFMCHLSEPLPVELGLPQGSILGPLMYTVYTNELPEVIHGHEPPETLKHKGFMFNLPCKDCGGVCCFADDSTFSISSNNPTQLNNSSTKLSLIL